MPMRRPSLLLASLTALLVLAATGCGAEGGGQGSLPPTELTSFATAADASAASESARFSLDMTMAVPGLGDGLSIAASGAFDNASNRAQMEIDLSSFVELLGGLGAAFGGSSEDLPTDPDDWRLEAILDGEVMYINFPLLSDQLPGGKTWVKGDLRELAGQAGGGLDQFGSFAETDPRDVFAYLKAVSGDIQTVGNEELRGVQTTHYRATIDVAKALELVPDEQRSGLTDLEQILGQAGLAAVPVDVWLDDEQRVYRLDMSFDVSGPGGATAGAEMRVDMWDYGVPVDLSLPSDDDVVDASELQGLQLQTP